MLKVVRSLAMREFSLTEVYLASDKLQKPDPNNLHVREKIRQQLQRLRDMGLLVFLGHGKYLLKP